MQKTKHLAQQSLNVAEADFCVTNPTAKTITTSVLNFLISIIDASRSTRQFDVKNHIYWPTLEGDLYDLLV